MSFDPIAAQAAAVNRPRPRWQRMVLMMVAMLVVSCRPGTPVIDPGARPDVITGTISGTVRGPDGTSGIADRSISVVEVNTGARHQVTTNADGHYTIKLPTGRYRLELALMPGESIVRAPGEVELNKSDLDPGRDFVVATKKQ